MPLYLFALAMQLDVLGLMRDYGLAPVWFWLRLL